jgi:23S rRNA pseudouridine2604 synthase
MALNISKKHVMTIPVRLAKRLAELVSCSRREAELYIVGGWVLVDGQVVEEPQFMVSQQKVELLPNAKPMAIEPVTILLHLPPSQPSPQSSGGTASHSTKLASEQVAGYPASERGGDREIQSLISADTRVADDHSGIRVFKHHFTHLSQCLPLESNASGLLVFTQDYRVSRKLTDDAATVEQEYVVEVAGKLPADGLKLLNHGLSYNGKPLPPIKVSWQNETRLRFALKGVQPGQIAHMCKSVELQVQSMKRIRIGRVSMAKLPEGQWRYLLGYERF